MGLIECSRASCDEQGLVEKEGWSGEPVSIVLKTSFRYTSSRYTLWLVYFDSLYQCLVSSSTTCLKPSDVNLNMANALRTHDFTDSQYLPVLKFWRVAILRIFQMWRHSEWSKLAKLRELSRTTSYTTRETVNRLACKQLRTFKSYGTYMCIHRAREAYISSIR